MSELTNIMERMVHILDEKDYGLEIQETNNQTANELITKFNVILSELRSRENDLKLLKDRENDAIVKFYKNGIITEINKGFENIFQYNSEEIIGKSFLKVLSGKDESFIKSLGNIENLAELLPEHNSLPFQLEAHTKSGKSILIEMTLSQINDEDCDSYVGFIRSKEIDPVNEQIKDRNVRKLFELSHIGFCFLDHELNIGNEYSKVLESYFSEKRLAEKSFIEVLGKIFNDKKIREVTVFLNLLLSDRLSVSEIDQMNPLKHVDVTCYDKNNETFDKQMEFRFKQIEQLNHIDSIFITIIDITENMDHLKKLHKSNDQLDKQIHSLVNIMHLDPSELQVFLSDIGIELQNISQILKRDDRVMHANEKIDNVLPALNYILSYSKALKINELENEVIKLITELSNLQFKKILNGSDFFSFVVMHERFSQLVEKLTYLNQKFIDFKDQYLKDHNSEDIIFKEYIEKMLEGYEKNYSKKSHLIWSVNEFGRLPAKYNALVKSICQVLLAFSLKENIEDADRRLNAGKPDKAQIKISFRHDQRNEYTFVYQDDGESISDHDAEKILLREASRDQRFFKEFTIISKKLKGLRSRIYLDCNKGEFFIFSLTFNIH
jgi:PAS domain S-box-containing protein